MKDDMGLIADAALTALHERANKLERIAMRMPAGLDRDELVWVIEAMRGDADQGRERIARLAASKR